MTSAGFMLIIIIISSIIFSAMLFKIVEIVLNIVNGYNWWTGELSEKKLIYDIYKCIDYNNLVSNCCEHYLKGVGVVTFPDGGYGRSFNSEYLLKREIDKELILKHDNARDRCIELYEEYSKKRSQDDYNARLAFVEKEIKELRGRR